ncbi:MAG: LysM peptidoglycan-binding domain-containing protein [Bacteroidales bacterium]|nr:LysM peptidoglycan-binding domain-containing protein [Bacteroidales bacterium]
MKRLLTTLAALCIVFLAGAVTTTPEQVDTTKKTSVWNKIFPPLSKDKDKDEAKAGQQTASPEQVKQDPPAGQAEEKETVKGKGRETKEELKKELEALRQENERLRKENESLRQADASGKTESETSRPETHVSKGKSHGSPSDTTNSVYALQRRTAGNKEGNYNMETAHFTSNVPDEVMIQRLKDMNAFIDLPYNETVKNWMILYSEKMPSRMSQLLGLSEYYMPIFEKTFLHYGLPEELKYLAIIESALNPVAVSRAGATGMWQFMYATAKNYGLEINSFVDERRDPYKSADAAARYLKDAYSLFGDWSLAISSYNCGAGNVNKAIKRAGGSKQFWDIYPYLPAETRGYVPAMVGAMYAVKYHREYGIRPAPIEIPGEVDTFHIHRNVGFDQIVACTQITATELRDLNPQYYKDIVPGNSSTPGNPYILRLHADRSEDFIAHQDSIYAKSAALGGSVNVDPGTSSGGSAYHGSGSGSSSSYTGGSKSSGSGNSGSSGYSWIYHKVKSGDTLGKIASKYGTTVNQIKTWNGLKSNTIVVGKSLKVGRKKGGSTSASSGSKSSSSSSSSSSGIKATHTVKSGETLFSISRHYGTTPDKIKKANGLSSDVIRVGQKLKIPK